MLENLTQISGRTAGSGRCRQRMLVRPAGQVSCAPAQAKRKSVCTNRSRSGAPPRWPQHPVPPRGAPLRSPRPGQAAPAPGERAVRRKSSHLRAIAARQAEECRGRRQSRALLRPRRHATALLDADARLSRLHPRFVRGHHDGDGRGRRLGRGDLYAPAVPTRGRMPSYPAPTGAAAISTPHHPSPGLAHRGSGSGRCRGPSAHNSPGTRRSSGWGDSIIN